MSRDSILIVSASAGAGHTRAAEAVRRAVDERGLFAEHVDVLDLAPRWVRRLYGGGFRVLAERAPRVWEGLYTLSDGPEGDPARWGPVAHRLLFRAFHRLLRSRPWSYCLFTHFLPAQLASRTNAARFGICITDYTLHRWWIQPRVTEYFTGNEGLAADVRRRVPMASVVTTGIPVDPEFGRTDRLDARRHLGITRRELAVLVMGGSFGLGTEDFARAALRLDRQDLRVLAVCGGNQRSHTALSEEAERDARLGVFGYVNDIERLMAAADVVVTKPGGLSTSEALALGRPLLLTRPLPGHEEANARYLTAAGAAVLAPDALSLAARLGDLASDRSLLSSLAERSMTLGRGDAAARIAGILEARGRARAAA